ncbi:MAG: pyrroline-5-carboxylate reductase [Deltaproteobacteria bacterium]|nr:pyrroline-5-carboxylate reductase [Deltaproteobacteria bacterium]
MKLGIVGGGTMGEIITRAIIQRELFLPQQVMVAELSKGRREIIASLGVKVTGNAQDLLSFADVFVLAVKPQNAAAAVEPLKGKIPDQALVISIMAGIDIPYLVERLGHEAVVRSMPNLPARIGEGLTVWIASAHVPDRLVMIARAIFQAMGKEVQVRKEGLLDAATAVSGTGPAYIFFIAENLLEAARDLGFGQEEALKLVRETFKGAMDLWAETGESPIELRRKVTSKGGTTHAAVTHFKEQDISGRFRQGVRQAYRRAKELAEIAKGDKSQNCQNGRGER